MLLLKFVKRSTNTIGRSRNFLPKKFRGIDSEQLPLFRGRKSSFRGLPRFTEVSIPKFGTEGNGMKKISFTKNLAPANRIVFFQDMLWNGIPSCFSSAEWFRTEFQAFAPFFVPLFRIPCIFLLCGTVRNGIPRIFCSAEQP